jgi:hypothetical protein
LPQGYHPLRIEDWFNALKHSLDVRAKGVQDFGHVGRRSARLVRHGDLPSRANYPSSLEAIQRRSLIGPQLNAVARIFELQSDGMGRILIEELIAGWRELRALKRYSWWLPLSFPAFGLLLMILVGNLSLSGVPGVLAQLALILFLLVAIIFIVGVVGRVIERRRDT